MSSETHKYDLDYLLVLLRDENREALRARKQAADEIERLMSDLAAAQRDAARYRHLRNSATFQYRNGPGVYWYLPRRLDGVDESTQLDQALDAAIASAGQEKP